MIDQIYKVIAMNPNGLEMDYHFSNYEQAHEQALFECKQGAKVLLYHMNWYGGLLGIDMDRPYYSYNNGKQRTVNPE